MIKLVDFWAAEEKVAGGFSLCLLKCLSDFAIKCRLLALLQNDKFLTVLRGDRSRNFFLYGTLELNLQV